MDAQASTGEEAKAPVEVLAEKKARRTGSKGSLEDGPTVYRAVFAKHDPAHCLAPGLFRSLRKGERKTSKLDVVYEYGEDERIEFKAPEPLGVDDMRVLQGLVAMAGPDGLILGPATSSVEGEQLRLLLEPRWAAAEANSLVVRGSFRDLSKVIGYSCLEDPRRLRASVERLWAVSIVVQNAKKQREGYRLLSAYASDERTGKLLVALNPRITGAILGHRPHTRIEMAEVRALKTDAARLVHQRLCGWIDAGTTKNVTLDTIMGYIWFEAASNESTGRKRRQRAREALAELREIGWKWDEYATDRFAVWRPRNKGGSPELDNGGAATKAAGA